MSRTRMPTPGQPEPMPATPDNPYAGQGGSFIAHPDGRIERVEAPTVDHPDGNCARDAGGNKLGAALPEPDTTNTPETFGGSAFQGDPELSAFTATPTDKE